MELSVLMQIMQQHYGHMKCGLDHTNAFELLVATMLSAQCTDVNVNKVTPALFARYPDAHAMAQATPEEIEPYIHSCGVYRNKARNLAATSRILVQQYDGAVPQTQEALTALPGVGNKTANVVRSIAFGQPAIAVDTHVFRVSHRLGLARGNTPDQTEAELKAYFPMEHWSDAHYWLIWHGRMVCTARKPKCDACPLAAICPTAGAQG